MVKHKPRQATVSDAQFSNLIAGIGDLPSVMEIALLRVGACCVMLSPEIRRSLALRTTNTGTPEYAIVVCS